MVDSSDYALPITDLSDHEEYPAASVLEAASQHHADAKYSNTKLGNNQIRTAGQMHTVGAAQAKYNQTSTKAP